MLGAGDRILALRQNTYPHAVNGVNKERRVKTAGRSSRFIARASAPKEMSLIKDCCSPWVALVCAEVDDPPGPDPETGGCEAMSFGVTHAGYRHNQ